MNKGERISRLVNTIAGERPAAMAASVEVHPCYRAFFQCWNERRYYEAHDVLEHLWLDTRDADSAYFKGLIQAAGGFVHLQKQFEFPGHPKHARRLRPAVRLFALADKNLEPFGARRHGFNIDGLRALMARTAREIVDSGFRENPWSPESAPRLTLDASALRP